MGMIKEFKDFAIKGNVVDMAVGIIIGAAFGKVISSLVADVIMPPIGLLVGGVDFSELSYEMQAATVTASGEAVEAIVVRYGQFIQTSFDFVIVAIALVPASESFSVFRALRILRALRLVSGVPRLRRVVGALLGAVPGIGAVAGLLSLIFYVFAVIGTKLFGEDFPQWFGTVGESMYSLFQIMTLESWSMGIVRPVMEVHPYAWTFFVPFIVVSSFTVLNLFIAIIVDSMQTMHEAERGETVGEVAKVVYAEGDLLLAEITRLRDEVRELKTLVDDKGS